MVGGGFEPPKALPADLQSAPFDRFGTPPQARALNSRRTPSPAWIHNELGKLTVRAGGFKTALVASMASDGGHGHGRRIGREVLNRFVAPTPAGAQPEGVRKPENPALARADARTRTGNLLLTRQLLYQLSYVSVGDSTSCLSKIESRRPGFKPRTLSCPVADSSHALSRALLAPAAPASTGVDPGLQVYRTFFPVESRCDTPGVNWAAEWTGPSTQVLSPVGSEHLPQMPIPQLVYRSTM
jgi:hypothetical protein